MPTVMIYQFPRSSSLRAAAMSAITEALVDAYGLKPEQIHISFHEVPDDRWGRGGILASEAGTTQTVPAAADA